jgi:lipoprotein-anchoring transpeptidase ErfK/SrfK
VRYAPRFSSRIRTSLAVLSPHMKDPVRLLVLERRIAEGRSWLRVLLPGRPNGRSGWILATAAIVRTSAYIVRVHLNGRYVELIRARKRLARYRVVVGAKATPTPTGRFAIYEIQRQRDSSGFIGPIALHLTARSRVLDNYGGGPGTIALHGRGPAALVDPLGSARSHGCIRMNNRDVLHLSRLLKAGTPVVITKR